MGLVAKLKAAIAGKEHQIQEDLHQIQALERELVPRAKKPAQLHVNHAVPIPRAGVDYAYGEPDLRQLRSKGITFICRYLGAPESKCLTREEALRISAAGMDLVTVFETGAQRALEDHPAGRQDAAAAQRQLEQIGAPHAVVYFAVDFELEPDQYLRVQGYIQGCQEILGRARVGVYGGFSIVHELFVNNIIDYGWQTYAWSQGRWSPHAQLRQIENETPPLAGVDCDLDRSAAPNFGQWAL